MYRIQNSIAKLITSLKESVIKITLCKIGDMLVWKMRFFADRRFDRRFGVDTSGNVNLKDLDIPINQKRMAIHYEPTPVAALRSMLKKVTIDHSKYTFVDYGSGKGRVLLLASEYPYRKIIGVELSKGLNWIADANVKKWKNPRKKCFNIELKCMNACDFILPGDPLVLFFFPPFKEPIVKLLVDEIHKSLRLDPRPINIFYYGRHQYFIDLFGELKLTHLDIYHRRPISALGDYRGHLYRSEV